MRRTLYEHAGPERETEIKTSNKFYYSSMIFMLIGILIATPTRGDEQLSVAPGMAGDYSSTTKSTGRFQLVGIGEGISAALYEWKITMSNDAGEGFLHNVPGECVGLGLYEEGMDHQSGYCTYTDGDGDKFYERYEHFGIVGKGKGWSLGGTGKYEGIETTHTYRFDAFSAEEGSHFESVAKRSGNYKFQAPVATNAE